MSSQKLDAGQVWVLRAGMYEEAIVLTLEVGKMWDKGYREVTCLKLEGSRSGSTVVLSNGAFNAPNKRIA